VEEWTARYSSLRVRVSELTGDNDFTNANADTYEGAHIIAATPEKWDYYVCKQRNVASVLSGYSLLLIDEVHCVGDEERGPKLEAIITRLRSFVKLYRQKMKLRTVAVSATLPNIGDIAVWLEVA
jgi:replicative superfamily II helicase